MLEADTVCSERRGPADMDPTFTTPVLRPAPNIWHRTGAIATQFEEVRYAEGAAPADWRERRAPAGMLVPMRVVCML